MPKTTPNQPTTRRPADELVEPISRELAERELDHVAGGKVKLSDINFTQRADKASPGL